MKAMTKSALAKAAGVSRKTLKRWLQEPSIQAKLAPFNLKNQQRILPPAVVEIIATHYVIEIS